MKTTHPTTNAGSSLVVVLSVLATLMVAVGVAAQYTGNINRQVQRSGSMQTGIAVGDGCIEVLFSHWRQICSQTPTAIITTKDLIAIPTPAPAQLNLPSTTNFVKRGTGFDPNVDELDTTYTISNYNIVGTSAELTKLAAPGSTPEPMLGRIDNNLTTTPGPTTPATFNYIASADVTMPAIGKDGYVVTRVRRVFQKQQMSPWNFAIFYVDPLEIHPGPNFVVSGWVHTNSDLFTAHNTLTFADKVTYGSDWFINFSPKEDYHLGQGDVASAPTYPSNLPPARDKALQPFGLDATALFNTGDPNPNNDNYHELIDIPLINPATGKRWTDPLQGERYYDQAAIKILIDASGNPSIYRYDGTQVTSGSKKEDGNLYDAVTSALSQTPAADITDNREQAQVHLTTLDINSLQQSVQNGDISNKQALRWNGIVYIADTSATASRRRGIRLNNGKVLPSGGLSIASPNPVYIQGDYNSGYNPPSNLLDPTIPEGTVSSSGGGHYSRQPSSVIADAVNILSNSWNDANSGAAINGGGRIATNTTVNTAIVSGIVPSDPTLSGPTSYSGGAENFPRFLENWGGIKFTYYGSMVELYNSNQSTGRWGKDNVYGAPTRQWYFDNNFKLNPPPGSLMIYSYTKGRWTVN